MKVTQKIEVKSYSVEMTADEAAFLIDIAEFVGGDGGRSRRAIASQMAAALKDAGAVGTDLKDLNRRYENGIYFKESGDE